MKHILSFPGMGIGEFTVDSTAFTVFGRPIAWYGIIITTGIILAVLCIYQTLKKKKLVFDDLLDIALCTVLPGIVGARLYYVFFDWLDRPQNYSSFYDVIAIWEGGLAIYGGLIFGALGCFLALRWKKIHIPAFFDALAPSVQLAQAIGRWGNFANAEAFGSETTLPWRMKIQCVDHYCSHVPQGVIEVHPTFFYESAWNLIGFVFAMFYAKKKKFDGEICLLYLGWYGLGRMIIEGLRSDSLYMGGIRISQLLAALCLIAAAALLIYLRFIKKYSYRSQCIYLDNSAKYGQLMGNGEESGAEQASAEADEADETDKADELNEINETDEPDKADSDESHKEEIENGADH